MKHLFCILALVMAVAAQDSAPAYLNVRDLLREGAKYLVAGGKDATTAKQQAVRKEVLAGLVGKTVVFEATVQDVIRHGGLGNSYLVSMTDDSRDFFILARSSTDGEKSLDLKKGDRVSVIGTIQGIRFSMGNNKMVIDITTIDSTLTFKYKVQEPSSGKPRRATQGNRQTRLDKR